MSQAVRLAEAVRQFLVNNAGVPMVVKRSYEPVSDLEDQTGYHLFVIPRPETNRERVNRETWIGSFPVGVCLERKIEPTDYERDKVMRFFHQQLDRLCFEELPGIDAKLEEIGDIILNDADGLINSGVMQLMAVPVFSMQIERET